MEKRHVYSTREKIRRAALVLFAQKGIKGTRTKDIANRARVAEVTIYRHFDSKHQIALDLFISYMNLLHSKLRESIEKRPFLPPPEKLSVLMDTYMDFARKEPEGFNYINAGHYTELRVSLKKIKKPMDVFHQVIKEGMASGDFAQIDPVIASGIVIGIMTRLILFHEAGMIDLGDESHLSEIKCRALMALTPCNTNKMYQS